MGAYSKVGNEGTFGKRVPASVCTGCCAGRVCVLLASCHVACIYIDISVSVV